MYLASLYTFETAIQNYYVKYNTTSVRNANSNKLLQLNRMQNKNYFVDLYLNIRKITVVIPMNKNHELGINIRCIGSIFQFQYLLVFYVFFQV